MESITEATTTIGKTSAAMPQTDSENSTTQALETVGTTAAYVPLLSDYGRLVFEVVNFVTISSVIGLFGICSNIINIIIFVKQRFGESMTVSLLGLTIADLIGLILLESFNICVNPLFVNADIPFYPPEVQYITVGWPHVTFTRITCLITVFVAIERCLCIKVPLKVKSIITPKRSLIVVIIIYAFMLLGSIPTYLSVSIGWKWVRQRNKTLLGLIESENREAIEAITIALNVFTQIICFGGIIGSNGVLVHALREKSKWRQNATGVKMAKTLPDVTAAPATHSASDSGKSGNGDHANEDREKPHNLNGNKESGDAPSKTPGVAGGGGAGGGAADHASNRDRKLGRMIVMLSAIVFLCYLPSTICLVLMMIYPEFSIMGLEVNIFFSSWSWVFVFDATNSSVNIFIYYNMSSKYRATFQSLFGRFFKNKKTSRVGPAPQVGDASKASVSNYNLPRNNHTVGTPPTEITKA